jgi:hypothetical protein
VGPLFVVLDLPVVQVLLRFGHRGKPVLPETLAPKRAVEGLDEAVVERFARTIEVELDAIPVCPHVVRLLGDHPRYTRYRTAPPAGPLAAQREPLLAMEQLDLRVLHRPAVAPQQHVKPRRALADAARPQLA